MEQNPEKKVVAEMARIVLAAARTAPKGKGIDDIVTALADRKDMEDIATEMEKIADEKGDGFQFLKRDAANVRQADAFIAIGIKHAEPLKLNCAACGFATCADMKEQKRIEGDYAGPNCAFKNIDLGIAIGSAVAKAKDLCIDNRIMYSAGSAARSLGLIEADVVLGIPLSVSGKNPFFDRKWP
ncbi:ferredoxin domain-containing protein [Methanohalophilus halophilus]|uniref:Uncharacterized protein, contains ferredoxin domain n=1 Tax=Methanohalophilus halophilus TaxID=2177 RepID=A0A1L3Q3C5_9EURY|nr:DUF2148 domain-containing protein [Methanohalophilus halophilus]APH39350.1 hypothetical protein BHR79_07565 [Methanohalophilus halophilus]RNI09581.1 hypothetical protein EFE40_02655 [Methanohalophilus halophilus]SDW48104.1 Uncharacterized protein, contains ferredoxin domain [Methanohalophilus halophilus]